MVHRDYLQDSRGEIDLMHSFVTVNGSYLLTFNFKQIDLKPSPKTRVMEMYFCESLVIVTLKTSSGKLPLLSSLDSDSDSVS